MTSKPVSRKLTISKMGEFHHSTRKMKLLSDDQRDNDQV